MKKKHMSESRSTKTVLIIEDEKFILDILVESVTREGFRVLSARDGEQGLKQALHSQFDLVLLDLVLPIVHGKTILKKMRETPHLKNIPVFVLTNVSDQTLEEEIRALGVQGYFIKTDLRVSDIMEKVKAALGD